MLTHSVCRRCLACHERKLVRIGRRRCWQCEREDRPLKARSFGRAVRDELREWWDVFLLTGIAVVMCACVAYDFLFNRGKK